MKKCSECQIEKEDDQFYKNKSKKGGLSSECKACVKQTRNANYNAEYERKRSKKNYERDPQYHLEKAKQWRKDNPTRVKEVRSQYQRYKWENDMSYKLRQTLSKLINQGLKSNNSSKNGVSCSQYLSFSFQELKEHLEQQFEPWMNWSNWGKYNSTTWDDNDPTTWTWQIDHIIPHSSFSYTSMSDQTFRECWAPSNLRPYSAKQNVIDGDRRYSTLK